MNDTQKSNRNIGLRLKSERDKRNLSQCDIAEILGMTRATVGNYDQGRRTIPATYVQNFCKALKVNPNKILEVK